MDFALIALIIAALAFFITSFGVVIEYKSIVISRGIQKWLMHESEVASIEREEQGNIGDQLEEWMLRETDVDGVTMDNLGALTVRIGHNLSASLRGASMQEKSVTSRIQNKYDNIVHDGILKDMPIEIKLLKKAAEHFGIDFDEMLSKKEQLAFAQSLADNGINLNMFNNGRGTSRGRM